jgi:hypothetical protein
MSAVAYHKMMSIFVLGLLPGWRDKPRWMDMADILKNGCLHQSGDQKRAMPMIGLTVAT